MTGPIAARIMKEIRQAESLYGYLPAKDADNISSYAVAKSVSYATYCHAFYTLKKSRADAEREGDRAFNICLDALNV